MHCWHSGFKAGSLLQCNRIIRIYDRVHVSSRGKMSVLLGLASEATMGRRRTEGCSVEEAWGAFAHSDIDLYKQNTCKSLDVRPAHNT